MNEATVKVLEALQSNNDIPREDVRRWMGNDNLETRALVYRLTGNAWSRIKPEFPPEQCAFMAKYLIDCIAANRRDEEYVHSGFEAAWEFAAWLEHLNEIGVDETIIRGAVKLLEELYRKSDDATRNRIETGAVEHALERKALRKFFDHWREDPELKAAHQRCLDWGRGHDQ